MKDIDISTPLHIKMNEYENWDAFYQNHKTNMYQDRHWLWQIFPELFPLPPGHQISDIFSQTFCCQYCGVVDINDQKCEHRPKYASQFNALDHTNYKQLQMPFAPRDFTKRCVQVLEIGCGVGNTVFPLLEKNAEIKVTCGDFSENAVQLLKNRQHFDENVINCQKIDILNIQLKQKYDYIVLNFILSALTEEQVKQAIFNCTQLLNNDKNSFILIFDYFEGDYREEKRIKHGQEYQKTSFGRLFKRRGEETAALYFNQNFIDFIQNNYKVAESLVKDKNEVNRKTQQQWLKRYILLKIQGAQ